MGIKHNIRKLFWKIGYDISIYEPKSHSLARKKKMFESYAIDTVLDVGANVGLFALQLRKDVGFTKRIISFEPQSLAFEILKANAKDDPNWEIYNYALGDEEAKTRINIAGNSESSSLLDMLPSCEKSAPESKYIGSEMTQIKTLDSFFGNLFKQSNNIFLKLDVQGFENKVLKGAEESLKHINTIQMEMSLVPLYKGELLFSELYTIMTEKGFSLVSIENGFSDSVSGQLMQVDGIFHRF